MTDATRACADCGVNIQDQPQRLKRCQECCEAYASARIGNRGIDHYARYEVMPDGCWRWTGPLFRTGYGHISEAATGGEAQAHRAIYVRHKGEIPFGLELDHLCRNRACVNPDHLEPVTRSVNIQRMVQALGIGARCEHDLTGPDAHVVFNRKGKGPRRMCRECWRISCRAAGKKYRDKKKAERAAQAMEAEAS